ncbi:MAG TPA: hypothetical protein VHA75_00940 [Rugosimonospora sp.]|nr:hypothetical protein [Rugosimonospora sp.]
MTSSRAGPTNDSTRPVLNDWTLACQPGVLSTVVGEMVTTP